MSFLLTHFKEGGWGMWPILVLFLVTIWLIWDRFRYLYTCRVEPLAFVAEVRKHLMQGDVAAAIESCRAIDKPLPRIVAAGLRDLERDDERVQLAVDSIALREFSAIEKRTGYLAMVGNVATLMGLLGTITGLIRSFAAVGVGASEHAQAASRVAAAAAQSKAEMLARGISEAMNCTAFGLGTGILALLAFSVLNGRTQNLLDEMNRTLVHVMNLATGHRELMNVESTRRLPETRLYLDPA